MSSCHRQEFILKGEDDSRRAFTLRRPVGAVPLFEWIRTSARFTNTSDVSDIWTPATGLKGTTSNLIDCAHDAALGNQIADENGPIMTRLKMSEFFEIDIFHELKNTAKTR